MEPFDTFSADTQMVIIFWGFRYFNVSPRLSKILPTGLVIRPHGSSVFFTKPGNALRFTLNSIHDLGLPAPFDFGVDFVGQIAHGPSGGIPGEVRWVVNQTVEKVFVAQGKRITIKSVIGTLPTDMVSFVPRAYADASMHTESVNNMFSNSGPADNALDSSTPELPGRNLVVSCDVDGNVSDFTIGNITLQIAAGSPAKPLSALLGKNMFVQFLDPRVKVDGVGGGIDPDPRHSSLAQALSTAISALLLAASLNSEETEIGRRSALRLASVASQSILSSVLDSNTPQEEAH